MLKLNTIRKNFYESRSTYEGNAFIQRNMAEKLASMLGNSYKTILEIGCGTGTLTKHIYAKCSFEQYHALDIVPEYGELLQNKFPKLHYTVFDMDMLQDYEPTRNFDLILSNAAIQWSKNPAALIRTINAFFRRNRRNALSGYNKRAAAHKKYRRGRNDPCANKKRTIKTI